MSSDAELKRLEQTLKWTFADKSRVRGFLAKKGRPAQQWLDRMQQLIDYPNLSPELRSAVATAMLHLSKNSGLHPTYLSIQNVKKIGKYPIAAGGFGNVWKGTIGDSTELVCLKVVKVYMSSNLERLTNEYQQEAILWRQMKHPNVLPFYGIYQLEFKQTQQLCLISPWMEKGNLVEFLKTTKREDIDHYALVFDVASGLAYLHSKKIVHSDLKGVNILITSEERACIADFGLSRITDSKGLRITTSASRPVGTARWLAPELLVGSGGPSKESDVYAFACVCCEIFTGLQPFPEYTNEMTVAFNVAQGKRPSRPEGAPELSNAIWALMNMCWATTPSSRPTASHVLGKVKEIALEAPAPLASDWSETLFIQVQENTKYRSTSPAFPNGSQPKADRSFSNSLEGTPSLERIKSEALVEGRDLVEAKPSAPQQASSHSLAPGSNQHLEEHATDMEASNFQQHLLSTQDGITSKLCDVGVKLNLHGGNAASEKMVDEQEGDVTNERSEDRGERREREPDRERSGGGERKDSSRERDHEPRERDKDKDGSHREYLNRDNGKDKDRERSSHKDKDRRSRKRKKHRTSRERERDAQKIIPPEEDIRRLFQECIIGRGNASLLSQALVHTTPEVFLSDNTEGQSNGIIKEFRMKCIASQELIAAQIPWASAGSERSRRELSTKREAEEKLVAGEEGGETTEERLLGDLLVANEELVAVLGHYEDLERAGRESKALESGAGLENSRRGGAEIEQRRRSEKLYDSSSSVGFTSERARSPNSILHPSDAKTPPFRSLTFSSGHPSPSLLFGDDPTSRPHPQYGTLASPSTDEKWGETDDSALVDLAVDQGATFNGVGAGTTPLPDTSCECDEEGSKPSANARGKQRAVEEDASSVLVSQRGHRADDEYGHLGANGSLHDDRFSYNSADENASDSEGEGGDKHPPTQYAYDAVAERTRRRLNEGRVSIVGTPGI
ncbi:hypothetical protein PQX77_004989 [Marasmius sp. AFHP31]|nr:hypothetical protein PQX77_004989 [Marasmius sp. AFHP31]